MKKLKNLLLVAVLLLSVSCTMSAKSDKKETSETATETAAAKGEVITLSKAGFLAKIYNYEKNPDTWVFEGDKPCIIDFYADWCPPCKQVAPILEELAKTYKDEIVIYKVNTDKEKELATIIGIQALPTFLFIPKNDEPRISMGALPKEEFVKQIESVLLGK